LIETIPLSWLRSDTPNPRFKSVRLPLSGLRWIHSAEIPGGLTFEEAYAELAERFGDGILIRGCRAEIAGFLVNRGFGAVRTGAEALVDLDCDVPSAAKEISRRGLRWGSVEEIPCTEEFTGRVSRFWSISSHGSKPRLRYLFHSAFDPRTRCFVFRTPDDRWLGAVTVSMTSASGAHTEMMLRAEDAPTGVMDALFVEIMDALRGEGMKELSLGEVPFVDCGYDENTASPYGQYIKEKLLFGMGSLLKYAYNFGSLYRFKNKFRPRWEPVYICAPKISWTALADIFVESGFYAVSGAALISSVRSRAHSLLRHCF